jgi:hypothetical protein
MIKTPLIALSLVLSILAVCFSTVSGYSQDTIHLKRQALSDRLITDRAPQAIYTELGGAGLLLSLNYDSRFSKRVDGLGFRVGVGYSFTNDPSFFTVPVGLNYLLGRNGNYFEVGAGVTYVGLSSNNGDAFVSIGNNDLTNKTSFLFTTISFGYRRQPINGGFNFRGGFTPVFVEGQSGIAPYISLGYNF